DTGHIVVTADNLDSYESELSLDEVFEHHELSKRFSLISSMIENCSELAMATDHDGHLVYANPATFRFFGFTEGQMHQSDIKSLFDLSDKHFEKLYDDIRRGDTCWVEASATNKNNQIRSFHLTLSPIKKDNSVRGGVVIATDISERKESDKKRQELQEKLKRAEKMESLGVLAGGVAHDLNNMLGPLVGYSDLILGQIGPEHGLAPMIQKIGKSARNAADVIQDLLTLARRGKYAMMPTDLNEVVKTYLESNNFLRIKAGNPKVLVTLRLDESIKAVSGSFTHLQKVIMNLIVNAYDAMPEGGELVVETRQQYVEELLSGHIKLVPGEYILLSVTDNGMGIEPEEIDKIFEPYFSKKKISESGSGLGLSVVYGIVKDHNGFYDIFSEVGKGTKFILYFPVLAETVREAVDIKSGLELKMGGNEMILVVDDVVEQRELAAEILANLGYKVETVKNGHEALQYLKYHPVDLIMLDMIMEKDFDGLDTYREIIKINPGQKVIVVSGFSQTDRVQKVLELGAGQYIKKPYALKDLADALRRELDSRVIAEER
ncbi:MAG: hybrid sensor histidine kinase/response regulator, partial [Candidatus Zixiibacteriota bacterium]